MKELRALTGARGIAAWLVVLYHIRLAIPGLPPPAVAALGKGYLAVDFFFLLSGFVIWLAWHDRLPGPGATAFFLRKRIARIWPLHLVMLAFALALALALRVTGRDAAAYPFDALPLHVFLFQSWGLVDPLAWNDPAWSISAEWAAYLLFPLLLLTVDWRRWSNGALLAAAAAVLAALFVAMRREPTLGADIRHVAVIRCLAEFTVGGIVAALWRRAPARAALPAAAGILLLAAALAGLPETLVVPAGFAACLVALAAAAGRPGNPLEHPALHRLGEISYATYLGHYLLWKAFKLAFVAALPAWWQIAAYLLLVRIASGLLYDHVERPAQRWIERLDLGALRVDRNDRRRSRIGGNQRSGDARRDAQDRVL